MEFTHFTMWVHKTTFLPIKTEYVDRNGKTYRVYEASKVETIDGHPTVTRSRMRDLADGGETVMQYENVKYDIGIPEDVFTERYLRNPPRSYLR